MRDLPAVALGLCVVFAGAAANSRAAHHRLLAGCCRVRQADEGAARGQGRAWFARTCLTSCSLSVIYEFAPKGKPVAIVALVQRSARASKAATAASWR
ncbi:MULTISPECIES: hypothetical protein [unclassified Mesorhizobium]|uniref:hypothetical protein n=1 Tax=unclassified Mesorhizobium TaxID=325217 RepID=UPI0015E31836|nr:MULTISPECIES: hypothetical protein [unclassified Mesorhizobium]